MTELLSSVDAPSDAELISRVRGGDSEAYGALFARHVDAARRLARQLTRGGDSEDLVSDAFTKVMQVLSNGGGPDVAFRAYLLTAVRRLHVDGVRAQSRLTTCDDMELFDPGVPFKDTAVNQFESGAAARAFASLPERWQLVLWHLEVEGQKPADIAPLLGMSANSVSALAYRAREGLRQAFLSAHLADTSEAECRWVTEHLGGYVRKGLAKRETARIREHLDGCRSCTAMYLELTEVNSNLRAILAPLLLGSLATGYLAGSGAGTGAGAVLLLLGRARDFVAANLTPVAAGSTAAGVAVATAVTVTVGSGHGSVAAPPPPPATSSVESPGEAAAQRRSEPRVREPGRQPSQRQVRIAPVPTTTSPSGGPADTAVEEARSDSEVGSQVGIDPPVDPSDADPSVVPPTGEAPVEDAPVEPPAVVPPPGLPSADVAVTSLRVSADGSLLVSAAGLPSQPATVLVELASTSGRTTFAVHQGDCEVTAATAQRATCPTAGHDPQADARDRVFRASLPLAYPEDLRRDRLLVRVGAVGVEDPDPSDNERWVTFRPPRQTPPGGRDIALAMGSGGVAKWLGRVRVRVSGLDGRRSQPTPLLFQVSPSDGSVGFERLPAGCRQLPGEETVIACSGHSSSYSAVFHANLRAVPADEPVLVTMTVTIPGDTDPRPANNTGSVTLRRSGNVEPRGPR